MRGNSLAAKSHTNTCVQTRCYGVAKGLQLRVPALPAPAAPLPDFHFEKSLGLWKQLEMKGCKKGEGCDETRARVPKDSRAPYWEANQLDSSLEKRSREKKIWEDSRQGEHQESRATLAGLGPEEETRRPTSVQWEIGESERQR